MNALEKFRPQWLYVKPSNVLEDAFDVPFSFTVLSDGSLYKDLPIQMDNEECIIRGIFFTTPPIIINGEGGTLPPYYLGRLIDTYGNPTSDVPTLNFGGWANPSGDGAGFPMEPEMRCAPGGVVRMDIQTSNFADLGTPAPNITVSGALRCVRRRKCQ
jgi:hypothetical protein